MSGIKNSWLPILAMCLLFVGCLLELLPTTSAAAAAVELGEPREGRIALAPLTGRQLNSIEFYLSRENQPLASANSGPAASNPDQKISDGQQESGSRGRNLGGQLAPYQIAYKQPERRGLAWPVVGLSYNY